MKWYFRKLLRKNGHKSSNVLHHTARLMTIVAGPIVRCVISPAVFEPVKLLHCLRKEIQSVAFIEAGGKGFSEFANFSIYFIDDILPVLGPYGDAEIICKRRKPIF